MEANQHQVFTGVPGGLSASYVLAGGQGDSQCRLAEVLACIQKLCIVDGIAKCQYHNRLQTCCFLLTVHSCNTEEVCLVLCLCPCFLL